MKHPFDESYVYELLEGAITLLANAAEDENHIPSEQANLLYSQ